MNININNKIKDYLLIENLFYNFIKQHAPDDIFKQINICYSTHDQVFLMELAEIIKNQKPHYIYKHIYIVIIFLYYALVLTEQTEDYLYFSIIEELTNNHINITKLIVEIASSEQEYARILRRAFFKIN